MKIVILLFIVFLAAASFTAARTDGIDLSVEMFPLSREIQQGETIIVYARMDTHEDEIADVIISYRIKNNEGLIVFESLETIAVEKTAKVIKDNVTNLDRVLESVRGTQGIQGERGDVGGGRPILKKKKKKKNKDMNM